MWKFLVKNQSIEILEREVLADHQIQYVQFRFTFDGDWRRFHKVVQFSQCDETYNIVLGTDGTSLYLPAELHVGAAKMSVFGYDTESDTTVRATTVPVTLNIRPSGFVGDDDPPIPPTPDLYAQLLKKIEEAGHGTDGKSAYEIAVEHGYVGTETEWLASLHGADGQDGRNGTNGRNGADGADGKSAYDIAVEHGFVGTEDEWLEGLYGVDGLDGKSAYEIAIDNGYVGTEAEWLESLHGRDGETPDLSEYAKTAAVTEMLAPVAEKAHTHSNKATLDGLTPELLTELQGLQQFEDSTVYDIQTINEALLTLNAQRHTHHNMTTLNGITDSHVERWELAYTSAMNLNERVGVNEGVFERFKTEILYDMQGCRTSISDILTRLSAVETGLSGVETALAAIVEVTT